MNNFTPDLKSPSSILELAEGHRIDISRRLAPKKRSEMGQFMTPAPIARFMAFLWLNPDSSTPKRCVSID